jgi:hypothetical protein
MRARQEEFKADASGVTPASPVVDADELLEAVQEAHSLADDVAHYSETAADIGREFEQRNERRCLTLDDMPYGEEQIRAREAAETV